MKLITRLKRAVKSFKVNLRTRTLMRKAIRAKKERPNDFTRNRLDSNCLVVSSQGGSVKVWIHLCPTSLAEMGILAAMSQQLLVDGKQYEGHFDIVIDQQLHSAPEAIRVAWLWHEIGHILLGHLNGDFNERSVIYTADFEHEADKVALLHGHDMVGAIEWLIENYQDRMDRTELALLRQRITRLQELPVPLTA